MSSYIKYCLEISFLQKKKKEFQNTFPSYRIFLELQCLVADLVDVLELPMFINIYMQFIFKKKTLTNDLN